MRQPYDDEAERELQKIHVGLVLDALPDDQARADQCRAWAAEQRNLFFQGRAESMADVLHSTSDQFAYLDAEARRLVGRYRWSHSALARKIIGDEELFRQWAVMWSGGGS